VVLLLLLVFGLLMRNHGLRFMIQLRVSKIPTASSIQIREARQNNSTKKDSMIGFLPSYDKLTNKTSTE
jgi:hypothetical protein